MAEQDIQYLHDKTSDFELVLCNNSVISYPLHNHVSVITIGLMLHGSILLTQNNKTLTYRPNQSFLILPYEPHIIEALEPYSLLTICIKKNAILQNDKSYITKEIFNLLHISGFQMNEIQTRRLFRYIKILDTSLTPSISEAYIELVKNQIECLPELKISLDEMAQSAFTSKYHFIRSFKQIVGLTPHQFQLQNRIRKAQHLLKDTDSITEVALATGFCDQSHFIKQFKKIVGLSPTVYKMSCQSLKSD